MAAKAVVKFKGKPFQLATENPYVAKIKTLLDKGPKDEVFTAEQVAAKVGVKASTIISSYGSKLTSYSLKVAGVRYFGNAAAVKALESQLGGSL